MSLERTSDPAAPAALDRKRLVGYGPRPWLTTVATALVWGTVLGALLLAPATLLAGPFFVFLIVPASLVGAVVGLTAAIGASAVTAAGWRLVVRRQWLGRVLAAVGGAGGSTAAAVLAPAIVAELPSPFPWAAVLVAASALACALVYPRLRTRMEAHDTGGRTAFALLLVLMAMAGNIVASLLDLRAWQSIPWAERDYLCDEGNALRVVESTIPPQSTCVYRTHSVELVPREDLSTIALVAGISLLMLAAAAVLFFRAGRNTRADSPVFALTGAAGAALLALVLAGSSLVGVLQPVATGPGRPAASRPPAPAEPHPDHPVRDPDAEVPDEAFRVPQRETPTTAFTPDQLIAEVQARVDEAMSTVGPVRDEALPPGTTTFPVVVGTCGGVEGTTMVSLDVWFTVADIDAGLERLRALWTAQGYALDPTSSEDRIGFTGTDPAPVLLWTFEDWDGTGRITVHSVCASGSPGAPGP
jgi:MFS family permease